MFVCLCTTLIKTCDSIDWHQNLHMYGISVNVFAYEIQSFEFWEIERKGKIGFNVTIFFFFTLTRQRQIIQLVYL